MAISRGYVHFQQILRQAKLKRLKFRSQWSKVPRVLGPLNQVMATLVSRPLPGEVFKPNNTQNGNFPGLRAFSANFATDSIEEVEIPQLIVKSAARFGAPKPSYGHFSHPAGHGRGRFLSRKTPKMAINRDFPGLRAFSANFATDGIEKVEIPQPMVKSAARFPAPKPIYGHFSHPAGQGRGRFLSRKTPKMAINRDFPGLRAFSAYFARDRIEKVEIPQPMVKSAVRFGAPKPSYGHFSHPAGHGRGRFLSRKTPRMAINRDFPGLHAFSANLVTSRIEEVEIPQLIVKSAARFGAPKPSYGHCSHPAGHGRGRFLSQKTPKMAINRNFPGLRAFSANFATDKIEEVEIPQPMFKSAVHFGAPKPSHGHFSHPATAGGGF